MSSLTFNKGNAKQLIMDRLARGVNSMLDTIESVAVAKAPVGKDARESGGKSGKRRSRGEAAEAVQINFISDRVRYKKVQFGTTLGKVGKTQGRALYKKVAVLPFANAKNKDFRSLTKAPVSSRRKYVEAKSDTGTEGLGSEAAASALSQRGGGEFNFQFRGKKSGKDLANVRVGPKGLEASSRRAHGYLKSQIHRTPLTIDGGKVSGKVVSGARYSAPVEFGWRGAGRKGTSSHAAQPFMRPGKKKAEANWRSAFKG